MSEVQNYLLSVDVVEMELAAHTLEYEFDLIAERMRADAPDERRTALLERIQAFHEITRRTVDLLEDLDNAYEV